MIEHQVDIAELLRQVRSGKAGRDAVIARLYRDDKLRNAIRVALKKYGASHQDFDHIFNTTLMQFMKTIMKNPDMTITSSLNTYLCGVAKYTWFHETKKRGRHIAEDIDELPDISDSTTPEKLLLDQGKKGLLHGLLAVLGKNCKEVLLHWANGFSMNEIAAIMNYKSDMMARKKKYQCFKELMAYLKDNPEIKNALY